MKIKSTETVRICLEEDEILVEYRDLVWFGQYKFYVVQGRGQSKYLIANVSGNNRTIQIHQLIMNPPIGLEVDHINGNGLDNRRANLRIVTHQVNQDNQPKRSGASSKFYGVYWDSKRDAWLCQIGYNGKRKSIGRFSTQESAATAYNNAVIKLGLIGTKRLNQL